MTAYIRPYWNEGMGGRSVAPTRFRPYFRKRLITREGRKHPADASWDLEQGGGNHGAKRHGILYFTTAVAPSMATELVRAAKTATLLYFPMGMGHEFRSKTDFSVVNWVTSHVCKFHTAMRDCSIKPGTEAQR